MKILLFGEFSGFHNSLKDGLLKNGASVTLISGNDGYKKIPNDINIESEKSGFMGKIYNRIYPFYLLKDLEQFDVIHIINPFFPNYKFFPKLSFYKKLKKKCKVFTLAAAGSDSYYWRIARQRMEYGPFNDNLKFDIKKSSYYMQTEKSFAYNKKIVDLCDAVIPVMHDYFLGYKDLSKVCEIIPLPINTEKIEYVENICKEKICIFHGITRYGFKGTKFIEQAFEILERRYPNKFEFILDGNMSQEKYLRLVKKANIIIDQVNTYSYGMNALYSLAMGKIVLSSAEPEALASIGIDYNNCPVINLKPNLDDIVKKIEAVANKRSNFKRMGEESRDFVQKYHNYNKIALRYLNLWSGIKSRQ